MTRIKYRPVGASATLKRGAAPEVVSATGGRLDIATHVSEAGFNPLDLLYASLAACLVLSARIAASRLGVLEQLDDVRADVTGEKAEEGPSRIARFHVAMTIVGEIDGETKRAIIESAESEICTVSNTLRGTPEFVFNGLEI